MSNSARPRNVVFVLYDGVQLLDVAGVADVFAVASEQCGAAGYEVRFVSRAALVRTSSGLRLRGERLTPASQAIHTLVVPGANEAPLRAAIGDRRLMRWLAGATARATRVCSVCSGAFVLGALGLLDHRRATTHWSAVDRLAAQLPRTAVDREALFVEDGKVWTAAGITSGIDLAMALIARDLGPDLALRVARQLVLHLVRPGGQSQLSEPLSLQLRDGPDVTRLIPWLDARLHAEVTVDGMASAMAMSVRTLHRRCLAAFAMSPGQLLAELRFDRARTLLRDPRLSVQTVATRSGFSSRAAFAKAFTRRYGASPTSFRYGARSSAITPSEIVPRHIQ